MGRKMCTFIMINQDDFLIVATRIILEIILILHSEIVILVNLLSNTLCQKNSCFQNWLIWRWKETPAQSSFDNSIYLSSLEKMKEVSQFYQSKLNLSLWGIVTLCCWELLKNVFPQQHIKPIFQNLVMTVYQHVTKLTSSCLFQLINLPNFCQVLSDTQWNIFTFRWMKINFTNFSVRLFQSYTRK